MKVLENNQIVLCSQFTFYTHVIKTTYTCGIKNKFYGMI